jgi:uncharacterized protein YyaL (SSP411 family)
VIAQFEKDNHALMMAEKTLYNMARSGLYDQVEGGFFRYTTDEAWQQPHFEKMLYTNAELIAAYAQMYLLTGNRFYSHIVKETVSCMQTYFQKDKLFFSASDADSSGEEGGYYLYDYRRVYSALKKEGWTVYEIETNLAYFGIEEDGNVDGELSHLHLASVPVPQRADAFRAYLKKVRHTRTFPFVDRKIITAWNAMMIKALFVAGKINTEFTHAGEKSLEKLLLLMRREGKLYHQTLFGKAPEQQAILEDYAFLADALIEGYERTYNRNYLMLAEKLVQEALQMFYREKQWYLSSDGMGVTADFDDRHYRSALSVMLENLLKLAVLQENRYYLQVVTRTIRIRGGMLYTHPFQVPGLLQVYLRLKKGDIVIHATKALLGKVQKELFSSAYPFLLSKAQENQGYLACGIGQCFAEDTNVTKLLVEINRIKLHKRVPVWQKAD